MKMRSKLIIFNSALALICIAAFVNVTYSINQTDKDHPDQILPMECSGIEAPEGTTFIFRTFAIGVQVYRWNGSSWTFVAPIANLYADAGFRGQVGTHYAGPGWESNSGSKVFARRVNGCTPEPNAIPWLLLEATAAEGPGIFANVSHIQRLYTEGGVAPTEPGNVVGEERGIPYTAEYYFYRIRNTPNRPPIR